jgi:hypothetical protein
MNVVVTRRPGWFGKYTRLDLLCNGKRVGFLEERESRIVEIGVHDLPATLQVEMLAQAGSPCVAVHRLGPTLYLECGANRWPLLDLLDIGPMFGLRDRTFYLREVATPARE